MKENDEKHGEKAWGSGTKESGKGKRGKKACSAAPCQPRGGDKAAMK